MGIWLGARRYSVWSVSVMAFESTSTDHRVLDTFFCVYIARISACEHRHVAGGVWIGKLIPLSADGGGGHDVASWIVQKSKE